MHVYRVAKKEGSEGYEIPRGPYRMEELWGGGSAFWEAMKADPSQEDHPTPMEEGLPLEADMYCCCTSKAKLNKWFPKEMSALNDEGYSVYEYDVPKADVFNGEIQSTAFFNNATLISVMPCVQDKPKKGK